MNMLTKLYDQALIWAKHRHAPRYLAAISFAESFFFPIPPDVMLVPMALARPLNAYSYALITTIFSVMGGIFGYLLGYLAFIPIVEPVLNAFGYMHLYQKAMEIFNTWGLFGVIIAAITPIPYKLFTVGAGVLHFDFALFVIGSILGRGGRFYLVALLIRLGGTKMQENFRYIISKLGSVIIIIGIGLFAFIKYI